MCPAAPLTILIVASSALTAAEHACFMRALSSLLVESLDTTFVLMEWNLLDMLDLTYARDGRDLVLGIPLV